MIDLMSHALQEIHLQARLQYIDIRPMVFASNFWLDIDWRVLKKSCRKGSKKSMGKDMVRDGTCIMAEEISQFPAWCLQMRSILHDRATLYQSHTSSHEFPPKFFSGGPESYASHAPEYAVQYFPL